MADVPKPGVTKGDVSEDELEDELLDDISEGNAYSDSEIDSVGSAEETEREDEEEQADAGLDLGIDSDESESANELHAVNARAPKGAHVVESNGYFSIIRNPKFTDVKVIMLPRWATDEYMGRTDKSKTLPIEKFDPIGQPRIAFLVLRSWMLYRVSLHGFVAQKHSRRKWYTRELERRILALILRHQDI